MKILFRSPETGELAYGDLEWYRCPIYEEVGGVPLIIHVPQAGPSRCDSLVTLPDLMPTVLELAGVAVPEAVQAESLMPLLAGEHKAVHDVVVTSWPLHNLGEYSRVVDDVQRRVRELSPSTVTGDGWTLMYSIAGEPVELYHTDFDPQQEKNVYVGNEDVAEQLHRRLVGFLETTGTDERLLATRRSLT
jgi:arylsulfatase A-like enzyme